MESPDVFDPLLNKEAPDEHGPFHRLQCAHINQKMCATGLVGGDRSYGTGFRRVHAYTGALSEDGEGIEFWTNVAPDGGTPPHLAYWTEGSEGIAALDLGDREIVAIPATIVKRVDGYAHCRCKL